VGLVLVRDGMGEGEGKVCEEVALTQWRSGAGGGGLARVNVGAIWEELREVRQDCGT
jgi:hypothetical protein